MSHPGLSPYTRNGNGSHHGDPLESEQDLHEEMRRLAAINRELLGNIQPDSSGNIDLPVDGDEVTSLRVENAALRRHVDELEQALATLSQGEEGWLERQKDFENLLEEKSEVIRNLYLQLQESQEQPAKRTGPGPSEQDLTDIEQAHKELEDQRRQLEDDEKSLMQQMRQMEMAMSKDRAEVARQRSEIQRMHAELNREIENAARDPGLREKLLALQRRTQGNAASSGLTASAPAKTPGPAPAVPSETKKQNSGLLRRIFGG